MQNLRSPDQIDLALCAWHYVHIHSLDWTDIFLVFIHDALIDSYRLRGLRGPTAMVKSKQNIDTNN